MMLQVFKPGDFLIFQIESGFGLLRVLDVKDDGDDIIWHLMAYNELFPDVEFADAALENSSSLTISHKHLALTNRAFESTQVAKMKNEPLGENELNSLAEPAKVSDRSVRLLLGLR